MLQFYFLSVVLNALAGYFLLFGGTGSLLEFKAGFSLKEETARFVVGILAAVTGLFKLLSPLTGDLPLIGDLFPAAAGILCGVILVFEHYRMRPADGEETSEENPGTPRRIGKVLTANKKVIGAAALIAAALHFLFPSVLLL